jgi:hypothetical protein
MDAVRRHREWQSHLEPEAFFDEVFRASEDNSGG